MEEPDFRALYEPAFRRGSSMSPRMERRLWRAALDLGDAWRQIRPIPHFLVEDLPPVARPWAEGEWLDRFAGCFEALAVRIAAGEGDQETLASCTGEEVALHLVIDQGEPTPPTAS